MSATHRSFDRQDGAAPAGGGAGGIGGAIGGGASALSAAVAASNASRRAPASRLGLVLLCVLALVAYVELYQWHTTSGNAVMTMASSATGGGGDRMSELDPPSGGAVSAADGEKAGDAPSDAGSAADAGADDSKPRPSRRAAPAAARPPSRSRRPQPSRRPTPTGTTAAAVAVTVRPDLAAVPGRARVCLAADLCVGWARWDKLQSVIDCWGRPGRWVRHAGQAALHGRKWASDRGLRVRDLPPYARWAWVPSGDESGLCSTHNQPFVPFFKGDFCDLLRGRRILLVGDMMNNDFRRVIADAAAPGLHVPYRPRGGRKNSPTPSLTPSPGSGGRSEPGADGSTGAAAEDEDDELEEVVVEVASEDNATAASGGAGGAAVPAASPPPVEVVDEADVEEEEDEDEEDEETAAKPTTPARGGPAARGGGGGAGANPRRREDPAAAARRKRAEEALLLSLDKDSIGRDGSDATTAEEDEEAKEENEPDVVDEEVQPASAPAAAATSIPAAASGGGGGRPPAGGRRLAAPRLWRRRLAAAAAQFEGSRSVGIGGGVALPANATGSAAAADDRRRARALRRRRVRVHLFRGAVDRICDGKVRAEVEYRRNDRLYLDSERAPRARKFGLYEFGWQDAVPGAGLVVLSRPVFEEADEERHLGSLRRALTAIRAANPGAIIIVRNVPPPHVNCDAVSALGPDRGEPLRQPQPRGWLAGRGLDAIASHNEALRLFLRLEFPGVLHMDVATSTALRVDGHTGGPDCTFYAGVPGPSPIDNWVRLLHNVLYMTERVRVGNF